MQESVYAKIEQLRLQGSPFALCTVIFTQGSVPRHSGSKMLVMQNGSMLFSVGGGKIDLVVKEHALDVLKSNASTIVTLDNDRVQLPEGGLLKVFIEPVLPVYKLIIFGCGHVAQALASLAMKFDFAVEIIDSRDFLMERIDINGLKKNCTTPLDFAEQYTGNISDYIVIAGHDHNMDMQILSILLSKPHAYLGMIGSIKKVEATTDYLLASGKYTLDKILTVNMPIGLKMYCETPHEIALSIVAKLVDVKNQLKNA